MQGSTRLVQLRRHGWLRRMKSKTGRKIIMRRRQKGRKELGCSM
jgi:large subunit ribosomal protein L34